MSERHATRRDQWRALWKDNRDALSIFSEFLLDDPAGDAARAASEAACERIGAFEDEMILATPVTSWADIGLLAEIAFSRMWPGYLLDGADASRVVAEGPHCMEQGEENAIGRLFLAIRQLCRDDASTGTAPHRERAGASVKDAAAEIVALINARPTSPRQDEIEAIISRVGIAPDVGLHAEHGATSLPMGASLLVALLGQERADALRVYQAAVRDYLDAAESGDDERASASLDALCAATRSVWERPVQTWADVILRAAVCVHWNGNAVAPGYPQHVLDGGPNHQMDEYALAALVEAVLTVSGLRFDADGILLSVMRPEPWDRAADA